MAKKLAQVLDPPQATERKEPELGESGNYEIIKGKKTNVPPTMRRVSFYVPEPLYNDLVAFAQERGDSITGVVRWSLGIGKAIWDEVKSGHRIQAEPPEGKDTRRELIFGRY